MGFSWDSHRNGNEKHISIQMGLGIGMVSVGLGMSPDAQYIVQKILSHCYLTSSAYDYEFF